MPGMDALTGSWEMSCSENEMQVAHFLQCNTFAKKKLTKNQEITGIMLAGGRSCRMGRDKGLCQLGGKPMVSYGLELLRQVCGHVLVSANDPEYERFGYPVVRDDVKGIGPIGGLSSSLAVSKTDHNIVISCDMPMLRMELLELLIRESPGYDAVVPLFQGYPEPLAAYYRRSARMVFRRSLESGSFKLQDALSRMRTNLVDMSRYPMMSGDMFLNLNTPGDLGSLEQAMKTHTGHEKKGRR